VLGWLASAGIDTTDPRVKREAEAVALAATRALRTRQRLDRSSAFSGSSFSSGTGGPFSSTNTTIRGGAGRSNLPQLVFGVVWVGVLAAGIVYISRRMRPTGATATAA
jgi:hypothetical protein